MYTTIFDVETTGLCKAKGVSLNLQPYITEIYALQVDSEGKIICEVDTLIKPPIPIPDFITKITGISDDTVRDAPVFAEVLKQICEAFFCSHTSVAHNLSFDERMLRIELSRLGKQFHFPWTPIKFCTVEQSMHVKGYRLKNSELYNIATGKEMQKAHRAKIDVEATYESYKWLVAGGK